MWWHGQGKGALAPYPRQMIELALRPYDQEDFPCALSAAALGRVAPTAHLGNTVGLTLKVKAWES